MFRLHTAGGKLIRGFQNVTFTVGEGEALGLSGPSGSGKSSILKCIYRTYLPTSGHIRFSSLRHGMVDFSMLSERVIQSIRTKEIGYVSQFLRAIPRVSAVDIVAEPLRMRGIAIDEAHRTASLLLERLLIPRHIHDASPLTFSGGEQQRVNVARAIIWKPRLLLLDEPTASLDKASVSIIESILKELKEEGTAMIGIFHDHLLMGSLTDRIYTIERGSFYG
jgi:alpha-D-ribose 1-methylphosphonate 5-triphosphate synthase subunit PhnL